MATLSEMSFAATVLLSSLVTMLCFMPPLWRQQTILASNASGARRALVVLAGVFHASLALGARHAVAVCPRHDNLNSELFAWNSYTAACLFITICIGGPVRIAAVATLGDDFLGELTPPPQLVTTGVYRYIQHPGYTGQIIILAANLALLFRWDGALACYLPAAFLKDVRGYGFITCALIILALVQGLPKHVKVEEALLRNAYGKKWERWHQSTKRFGPGVF
jgi:protein-S-isoprenylcysteine O-methyltransferase Ste14